MSSHANQAYTSNLNLFQSHESDISHSTSFYVAHHSQTNIREQQVPLEFNIPGALGAYLNLRESYLYLRGKVVKADGKPLEATTDISTTNFFLHSLFDLVEVFVGSTLVSSKPNYNYCAYLLAHLSYNDDYKRDILQNAFYFKESNLSTLGASNAGYAKRKVLISESKEIELMGPIYDDILFQERYIIPNVPVRIKLKRSVNKFSLLSPVDTAQYGIEFLQVTYVVKKHVVSPQISQLHERQLSTHKALYPYTLNQIKTLSIPQNSLNAVFENIFPASKVPQVMVFGFVEADAYNGKYSTNPFCFQSFDIINVNLTVNQVGYECRNLKLKFNDSYLIAFQTLLSGLNAENRSIGINRESYIDGNVLFAFQLMGYDGNNSSEEKAGNIKLEITLCTAVSKQLIGICLAQSPSLMTIDKFSVVELANQGVL